MLNEPSKHLTHKRHEACAGEPVVERLVCDGDAILVIELAQEISEGLDLPTAKSDDERKEQPAGRDRSKPLALPSVATDLIDVVDGQRPCKRTGNSGKLRAGQRSLLLVGVVTPAMRLSLSLVYPKRQLLIDVLSADLD
jgi:hypothetical protein